jgi:hypothetical protein
MLKTARVYATIGITIVVIGLLSLLLRGVLSATQTVVQPIAFNHKIHIETASMNCKDCHLNVETMARASIPALEVCQTCHSDEPISKSPVEKEVLRYVAEKREIPWVQIYSVPAQVYFSHRRHVMIGGLECSSCHGSIAAMTTPVSYQAVPVTMENCVNCHKQHKVTNDCLACHH